MGGDCIECVSIAQILLCHEGPGHPVEAGGGEVQLLLLLIWLWFCLFFLFGSNLGEVLPWNIKMYNPKVTWKLKKQEINAVDWVSPDAVRRTFRNQAKLVTDTSFVRFWLVVFLNFFVFPWKLNFIFCLNEVFIVVNC